MKILGKILRRLILVIAGAVLGVIALIWVMFVTESEMPGSISNIIITVGNSLRETN